MLKINTYEGKLAESRAKLHAKALAAPHARHDAITGSFHNICDLNEFIFMICERVKLLIHHCQRQHAVNSLTHTHTHRGPDRPLDRRTRSWSSDL